MSVFEDRYKPNMEVKQKKKKERLWALIGFHLWWSILEHFLCGRVSTVLFLFFPAQLEDGKQLVRDAIAAGIFCDLGSGSNIDLCVIMEKDVQYLRGYDQPVQKGQK